MTPKPQIDADLSDPRNFDHGIPQDAFAQLRAIKGLAWNPVKEEGPDAGFWSVGRFDDIVTVSRDTETFSSAVGHIQIYNIDEDALSARASMIDMDPPEHSRLRRLVNPGFIPKNIRDYAPVGKARAAAMAALAGDADGDHGEALAVDGPQHAGCREAGDPMLRGLAT